MNNKYTNTWVQDFSALDANKYDTKFMVNFEKNVKHRQQVNIIRKYLSQEMDWLDAPVGSGRMMHSIKHPTDKCYIFDYSEAFLDFSKNRLQIEDSHCYRGDLFNFKLGKAFDLITCNNVLFAFSNFEQALSGLLRHLNLGGILIFDIPNAHLYNRFCFYDIEDGKRMTNGWDVDSVYDFFEASGCEVLDIIPHDYYDSEYVLKWRFGGGYFEKRIKLLVWRIINKLYFKLNLFPLLNSMEDKEQQHLFNKLVVVVRKNVQ